jgi:CBS domain-containing protein
MSRPVYSAAAEERLGDVAKRFLDHRIGAVPVTAEDGRVVGIFSYVDAIRELLRHPVRVEADDDVRIHG